MSATRFRPRGSSSEGLPTRPRPRAEQRPSRRKTVPGDVFSIKIPDGYLLGRVVANTAKSSPWDEPQLQLLYIYTGVRKDLESITLEDFRPPNLLIPPVLTNRMGWTCGYYETLTNIPLESADLLKRHVFREPGKQNYWDENSEPVEESESQMLGPTIDCF